MRGHITQISVSDGGVPKTAVSEAEITATGLVGDRHNSPKIHGGPEKAVCLWSLEVIEALQLAELDNFFQEACIDVESQQID